MNTTSGAVSRLLHLLSLYPNVQTRHREEILKANVGEERERINREWKFSLRWQNPRSFNGHVTGIWQSRKFHLLIREYRLQSSEHM